jgi:uncharacterized protein YcbK (DUF882 family)
MVQDQEGLPMLTRRHFLLSAGAAGASFASTPVEAAITSFHDRSIFLHNVHTGESLKTVYWSRGHYDPGAMKRLNHLLRDHYSEQVHRMDPRLIDLLCKLQHQFGGRPFEVFSAYRCPATNAWLAANSEGVAAHSLHMQGMAADIRVSGVGLHTLKRAARGMKAGGVGGYSSFVHVDVGRVRYW